MSSIAPGVASVVDRIPPSAKICAECGRSFTKAAHLLRHARSHVNEKPFPCPMCGKSFSRTDALQRHERTVHPGKRRRTDETSTGESINEGTTRETISVNITTPNPSADPFYPGINDDVGIAPLRYGSYGQHGGLSPPRTSSDQSDGGNDFPFSSMELPPFGIPSPVSTLPSFLTAYPPSMLSTGFDLDELLGDLLKHDGGAPAAENALAMVLSEPAQNQTQHMAGVNGAYQPLQNFFAPEDRPSSSRGLASQSLPNRPHINEQQIRSGRRDLTSTERLRNITAIPPEPAPLREPAVRAAGSTRTTRSVLIADTWESGILSPRTSEPVNPNLRLPSRITSPEQVVGELHVDGEEVM